MSPSPDLIIAFAFSLMSDGAPGSYNLRLAQHLQKQLEKYRDDAPYVAVQWEIADAMAEANPALLQGLRSSDKSKLLQHWLTTAAGNSIAEQLNSLLDEANFYEGFGPFKLNNLERPELGELFTEYRSLPRSSDYPLGLSQFQRKRINRLIIERLVDDVDIVRPGRYLSTAGVIDFVANQLLNHSPTHLQKIGIVAHPLHAPRCIEQTKQAMSAKQSNANIYAEGPDQEILWDEATAQIWCRSLSNWSNYEKIVQKLIAQRSSNSSGE